MTQENKSLPKKGEESPPIEGLRALFKQESLNFPTVSEKFHSALKEVSPFLYSTRSDETPNPYTLAWFLDEIQTKQVDDYLIIGNAGHGVNSRAMHVYFIDGPFAYFLQKRWGGAFGDPEIARKQFNSALLAINLIRTTLAQALDEKRIKVDHRLILIESDFFENKWIWLKKGSGAVDEEAWNIDEPTLLNAWVSIPKE